MREEKDIQPCSMEIMPGVSLSVCSTERFKVGYLSIKFLMPASFDVKATRMLLLKTLCRGTEKYPTMAKLNLRLDELYATPVGCINNAAGYVHTIGFSMDILEKDYLLDDDIDLLGEVLDVITQNLYHPLLDSDGGISQKYLEAEKKNTIDYIHSIANQPIAYAGMRFLEEFYGSSDYAHVRQVTEEMVDAVKREDVMQQWQKMITSAPMQCFYIGKTSPEEIIRCLREHLGKEMAQVGYVRSAWTMPPLKAFLGTHGEGVRSVEETRDVGQSQLLIGCRTGVNLTSPQFYAMMLCHEIFGVSPISRLFVHVREEKGLCYTCSSDYYITRGDIIIFCGIRAQRREEAQTAIFEQIDAMKKGLFSDEELLAARKSLDSAYQQIMDSTKGLANFYDQRQQVGIFETPLQCREHFRQVTREDVIAAAQLIQPDTVYFLRGTGQEDAESEEEETGEDSDV